MSWIRGRGHLPLLAGYPVPSYPVPSWAGYASRGLALCLARAGFGHAELGANVAGLRGAEVGVESEGLLAVAARLGQVAGGLVAAGEAVMGAGLLVLVVDLAGQAERHGLLD